MGSAPLVSPGQVLDGKYVVERILGEGGMGLVVAASHIVLRTQVAIKILLPEATRDAETVSRFHREARSAVRLQSPYAGRVQDVGQLADGTPYMVMDLLAGRDLDRLLAERAMLPPAEVVGWMLQALAALQEAHALGIIHRDLKPANLFLADQPNGPPIVKVLDFGIARDFHEGNEQRLTRTRAVMGSPAYMSPEQMREARTADARSDIWSLGVCVYELLTGKSPFNAATLPDLFVTVLHGTPLPIDSLRPGVPGGLSAVVLRCLEKDPARRFQSAAELAQALTPYASEATWPQENLSDVRLVDVRSGSSPLLPASPTGERLATSRTLATLSPPAPRRKTTWIGVLAVGIVILVVGVFAVRGKRRADLTAASVKKEQPVSAPVPIELSTAGGLQGVPAAPVTGGGAAPEPNSPALTSGTVVATPPKGTPVGTGRPVVRTTPSGHAASATATATPVPATPPPAAPATFDPKSNF
ncbi:hypothetical protein BH11MYX4_BH11MYX4_18950 [soil metagenome]